MPDSIMPNVVVSMPSQLFTLARSFKAVSNGKIYIGKIDTDPTIPSNQIQVYIENEDGSHVPTAQPININAAGYPVYGGQITKFVTVEGHSMAVYDSYGAQQFYFPNILKYDPDQLRLQLSLPGGVSQVNGAAKQFEIVADMQSATWLTAGMIVETVGYHDPLDGGGNTYEIINKGALVADGGSLISLSDSTLIAKASFNAVVGFRQFGGIGDRTTDDTSAFIAATNYCRTTGYNLDISGMKIVLRTLSAPISIDGYWIIGNGVPTALPALYYDYLIGGDKADEVWMNDSDFEGSGIYCPANVTVFTGKAFQIQDVCMYGNYNQTNNKAFSQTTVTAYPGWSRALQDTRVTIHYFGSFGIELRGGLEVCSIKHVKIAFCKRNCLLVAMTTGINCPIEYLDFDSTCYFMYSKTNNVLLNGFRKHVYFENVLLNGPGQYDVVKQQDPSFTITNPGAAIGAVSVVGLAPGTYGDVYHNASYALRMNACYAEAVQNLLTTSGAFINDVTLTGSTTYPVDATWAQTHLLVYNNTSYIKTSGNASPDGKFYCYLANEMVNSLVAVDFGEEALSAVVQVGFKPAENIRIIPNFSSRRISLGNGAGGGANVNLNTLFPNFGNPEFVSAKVMLFSVTATYQLGTLNNMGAYIVFATRMPSGDWKGIVMSSGITTGFTAPPSIAVNGDFSMDITAGYRVSITRIDEVVTN